MLVATCAKVKFGARCTASDEKQLQEVLCVVVSKEAIKDFDKRINKSNCLDS